MYFQYMNYRGMIKAELIINLLITNYIRYASCIKLCNIKCIIKQKYPNC